MKASKPQEGKASFSKSIVLVSSIAGITEAPGLFTYSTSKHGVIGLMRALRPWAPLKYGVRVNALCPWATDTQLLGVKDKWVKEKMPLNTAHDVGKIMLQCSADQNLNGKAVFVTGGRFFDTEEGIDRTLPQWMGEENAKEFLKGQEILGLVSQSVALVTDDQNHHAKHFTAGRKLDGLMTGLRRYRERTGQPTLDGLLDSCRTFSRVQEHSRCGGMTGLGRITESWILKYPEQSTCTGTILPSSCASFL